MEQYSFEKHIAYQKARKLVADVYHLIAKLPQSERFATNYDVPLFQYHPTLQKAVVEYPSKKNALY